MCRVPELRDVPLAVLGQLNPVPPEFLRQLSKDKELFADLPPRVQSQVPPHLHSTPHAVDPTSPSDLPFFSRSRESHYIRPQSARS